MEAALSLTLLATIFAIYTVLPEYKKLRAGYAIGIYEKWVIVSLAVFMIFFLIKGIYVSLNYGPAVNTTALYTWGYNEQYLYEFAYIMTSFTILLIFIHIFFTNNNKIKNKDYFIGKIDELYGEKKYPTLISLIEDNYENIFGERNDDKKLKKEIIVDKNSKEDILDKLMLPIEEEYDYIFKPKKDNQEK
nr:hypothetical protein [uncultured Methanobacterium sp.]